MTAKKLTIAEQIDIAAGAIRSRAREIGKDPKVIGYYEYVDLADAQSREQPDTIAGNFLLNCTDAQWQKVKKAVRGK